LHPTIRVRCGKCRRVLDKVRGHGRVSHFFQSQIALPVVHPDWDGTTTLTGSLVTRTFVCRCRAINGNPRQYKITEAHLMDKVDRARRSGGTEVLLGADF